MKHSSIYGIALIVGAVGGVVTMMFHPTSRDLVGPIDQIARRNEIITVATHALALISIPISFFGFLGLSRLLSLFRRFVLGNHILVYLYLENQPLCTNCWNHRLRRDGCKSRRFLGWTRSIGRARLRSFHLGTVALGYFIRRVSVSLERFDVTRLTSIFYEKSLLAQSKGFSPIETRRNPDV